MFLQFEKTENNYFNIINDYTKLMTNCWLEDEMYCLMILYRILSGIFIISFLCCLCIYYKKYRTFNEDISDKEKYDRIKV